MDIDVAACMEELVHSGVVFHTHQMDFAKGITKIVLADIEEKTNFLVETQTTLTGRGNIMYHKFSFFNINKNSWADDELA